MGNLSLCRTSESRSNSRKGLKRISRREWRSNVLLLEAEEDNVALQLYGGFCAVERSDVTVNVSNENMCREGNEQEKMLYEKAGEELCKETKEYIAKHNRLHYKLPFYTHAGELPVNNVIHVTLSEDKRIISDSQILQAFIDCLQIADEELEAASVSLPMIYLRNYSPLRIARLMIQAVRSYISKAAKRSRQRHLQLIKIIGEDTKLQLAYISATQEAYGIAAVNSVNPPRKISEQLENIFLERQYSQDEHQQTYLPSFNSDSKISLHYYSKEVYLQDM